MLFLDSITLDGVLPGGQLTRSIEDSQPFSLEDSNVPYRPPGLLNGPGSRLKLGWSRSGEFGGGWNLRLGVGRDPVKPSRARAHKYMPWTHVPDSVWNDLVIVIRELNGVK